MGIRDDAEKIIAEQDRQAGRELDRLAASAKEYLPAAMSGWSSAMGLRKVPVYAEDRSWTEFDEGTVFACVDVTFMEDGLSFRGHVAVRSDSGEKFFSVTMPGTSAHAIGNAADLADVMRELDRKQ